VADALPVNIETVPLDKALEINNLRAVFGERYPDPVRVVSIGPTVPELLADPASAQWEQYSIELCGGTHLGATSRMEQFALVEESAVAKGVRRVVGVTGQLAAEALATGRTLAERMGGLTELEVGGADAPALTANKEALTALKIEIDGATISTHLKAQLRETLGQRDKLLAKRLKELQAGASDRLAAGLVEEALASASAGGKYVVLELEGIDGKAMQPLVKRVIKETSLPTIALSVADGKVACFAAVPDGAVEALPANTWLKPVLEAVGGRGGGKAAQAQGSGPEVDGLAKAVEAARSIAGEALGE